MLTNPLISPSLLSNENLNSTRLFIPKQNPIYQNLFLCLLSTGKIIIDIKLLLTIQNQPKVIKTWLILSTICDLTNMLLLISGTLIARFQQRTNRGQNYVFHSEECEEERSIASLNIVLTTVLILNNCYFYFLFGMCYYLWLQICFECPKDLQLTEIYICFNLLSGLMFIGFSLVKTIITKNFANMLTLSLIEIATQANAIRTSFIKFPVKIYSPDLESPECYICLLNYWEGDRIIELPCSSKHRFHEECIKKWLKLKDFCPLCRRIVKLVSDESRTDEIELQILI